MKKVIITSGGTIERIDEVRVIRNSSSGRLGARIADVCHSNDSFDTIYYLASKDAIRPECFDSDRVVYIETTDAESVFQALKELLTEETIDFVVHSMAVADYKVAGVFTAMDGPLKEIDSSSKISSSEENLFIKLKQNPKIIDSIRLWQARTFLVGFKLLEDVDDAELEEVGFKLLRRTRANLIVANDLKRIREGNHEALIIYPEKRSDLLRGKEEIAEVLVDTMIRREEAKHIRSTNKSLEQI